MLVSTCQTRMKCCFLLGSREKACVLMYIISLPVSTFFLHCICGINTPQHERNSLCDSKQKRSILTSDPQMICEAHSHPSQEKPCIMVRNAAFRALLSLLECMAKPLLGHSQTHLQKLFSWHWGYSETSRDGKPDCLCHSVMVWSRSIPPCMLSSLWS